MRICLDPGHDGVIDPGAVGQGGALESDVALAVCQYAKEFLEANGHQVMLTRSAPDADVTGRSGVDAYTNKLSLTLA